MAGHPSFPLVLTDRRFDAPDAGRLRSQFVISKWIVSHEPNVVLLGAILGLAVGILVWGYLTMSVIAGVDSLLGETEPRATVADAGTEAFDCASFGAVRALSAEDEARFQSQCGAPAQPVAQQETAPVTQPRTEATAANRADCEQIRGTDYLSGEERTWFLANCISR
jgi:hypothetical protein